MANCLKKFFSFGGGQNNKPTAVADIVRLGDGIMEVSLTGMWTVESKRTNYYDIEKELYKGGITHLKFNVSKLEEYDSTLVSLLFKCYNFCKTVGIFFDMDSLNDGLREMLKLAVAVPEADSAKKEDISHGIIGQIGQRAIGRLNSLTTQAGFIGEVSIAFVMALRRKARFRIGDLLSVIQRAGPEALPIVSLISFLVGLILAFVGAIQLAKYGSEIFVADLVGIAMVREMGAIMVGIVMSGRTGAAFAAELGAMKVNEEISAFKTFGISPIEFLVYPRVIALVLMFPLLTVFADVVGMIGGMVIGIGMFDISYEQYFGRTLAALNLVQISTGVLKSLVFGVIVAVIGCQKGMNAENSSSGVGLATTQSVVQSITWIIVADAIFAVAFTIFDI